MHIGNCANCHTERPKLIQNENEEASFYQKPLALCENCLDKEAKEQALFQEFLFESRKKKPAILTFSG